MSWVKLLARGSVLLLFLWAETFFIQHGGIEHMGFCFVGLVRVMIT